MFWNKHLERPGRLNTWILNYFFKPFTKLFGLVAAICFFPLITTAQSLLIDVSVSNQTPGASDVFKYRIRYRCASITQHCQNAQIVYTIPAALEIVNAPAVGGNVASATVSGNMVTVSLISPPSVGAPAGALAAGSSGILETQVRFKCGTNGVAPVPAAGTLVNFSMAGLPTFTATGATTAVAAAPLGVTTPVVPACAVTPPTQPPGVNFEKFLLDNNLTAGQNAHLQILIPTHTSSVQVTDIFPPGMYPYYSDQIPAGGMLEVYSNGNWFNVTSTTSGGLTLESWFGSVAVGAPLMADGGVNTGSVRASKTYADGTTTNWGSNITGLRYTSPPGGASQENWQIGFHVDDHIASGEFTNCVTETHPVWETSCATGAVAPDKPYVYFSGWSEPQIGCCYPANGNLGSTTIPPAGPWPPGYATGGANNVPGTKSADDVLVSVRAAISRASEYPLNGFIIDKLLPLGWDYVTTGSSPNFWTVRADNHPILSPTCATPVFTRIPNYNGTGRTYLKWEFPTCILPRYMFSQNNGGELGILLNVSVRWVGSHPLTPTYSGSFSLSTYSGEQLVRNVNPSYQTPSYECVDDLTADVIWTFPTSGSNTDSWKDVKGALDTEFSRYPATGNSNLNGDGDYVMYVKNTGFVPLKQLDVADILPYVGDMSLTVNAARNSQWSEELAGAISIERYTIGSGWSAVAAGPQLPLGILYASTYNSCYSDGGGQIDADPAQANSGQMPGCVDMSAANPASGAKGFAFRWLNAGAPLTFGEMLRITVDVRQLTGQADLTNGEVAWNSFAYTATVDDGSDTELFSTEPIKVGLKMIDPAATAAIGDYVWIDSNGNGRQDNGETPVEGIEVSLYDASGHPVVVPGSGGVQVTTLTDATGYYCFPGLSPNTNYSVRLEDDTDFSFGGPLSGYVLTTNNAAGVADDLDSDAVLGTLAGSPLTPRPQISAPTLAAGSQTKTYDFGFVCLGTVTGYVWMDSDEGGDQTSGEMPLSGVIATLKDAVSHATIGTPQGSGSNGAFTFSNVPAGIYYVEFSNFPAGKVPTHKDLTGNDSNDSDVNANGRTDHIIISSCSYLDVDLGLRNPPTNPAAICGAAWDDLNKNGAYDVGEPGIANVVVQLLDANGFVMTSTQTDANGDYCFYNLAPNVGYRVAFVPPTVGMMFSVAGPDQDVDLVTGITTVLYTPTNNQTINDVDAGFMGMLSIGNLIWHDVNNNGIYDLGEAVFSKVPVRLIAADGSTILAATTTDANGRYVFKFLDANTYFVAVEVPANFSSSTDIATSGVPNALDSDDNGAGSPSAGYIRSAAITLANNGGTSGDANWTESDHGLPIDGVIDPTSNPKAYYTVDFGFRQLAPCALSALSVSNRSSCNNNGTVGAGNEGDDWITADIILTFNDPPATGNLVLTGDVRTGGGALSVPVASIGAGPTYTFTGVRLVADGTSIAVTATFDADPTCTVITNSVIAAHPSCSSCPDIPCGGTNLIKN